MCVPRKLTVTGRDGFCRKFEPRNGPRKHSCEVLPKSRVSPRAEITSRHARAPRAASSDSATHSTVVMPPSPGARDPPRARNGARAQPRTRRLVASGFYAFLLLALTALAPRVSALALGEDEAHASLLRSIRTMRFTICSDEHVCSTFEHMIPAEVGEAFISGDRAREIRAWAGGLCEKLAEHRAFLNSREDCVGRVVVDARARVDRLLNALE